MTAEGPFPPRPWLLVLCYAALLALIPLWAAGRDREIRWHARNGLLLFAAVAAVGIAATLIGIVVPAFSCLYAVGMAIASLLYVMVAILGTVKALQGERLIIPWVSRHASRLAERR
jgi:uncharacterized membrane protein